MIRNNFNIIPYLNDIKQILNIPNKSILSLTYSELRKILESMIGVSYSYSNIFEDNGMGIVTKQALHRVWIHIDYGGGMGKRINENYLHRVFNKFIFENYKDKIILESGTSSNSCKFSTYDQVNKCMLNFYFYFIKNILNSKNGEYEKMYKCDDN